MAALEMFDNIQNAMQLMQNLRQDPVGTLAQRKYNIPNGMTDPNEIINHLTVTGQVSQQQVNQAMAMRNNPLIQKIFGGR